MNFQQSANLAQIVACAGIVPGFLGIYHSMEQQREEDERTGQALRLTALGAVNAMIEKDITQQPKIRTVIQELETLPISKDELLKTYGTGKAIYYGIPGLAQVGRHYEHLGAMLKLDYIDFDLVFEVISFPDDFWESTQPLMTVIRENWGGEGKPLPDLWVNFSYLRDRYHQQRAINAGQAEPESNGAFSDLVDQIRGKEK